MNWKNTLFVIFWLSSSLFILGLPSCKPCDCDMGEITAQDTVVPPAIAACRISAYNDFAGSFKELSDSLGYNIINYNAGAFSIPIASLYKIDSLGSSSISKSEKAWTMLALDPATPGVPQTIKVYLAAQDSSGVALFYDITNREAPNPIPSDTARANIEAFQAYVNQLTAVAKWKGREIFYPIGFQYPWRDIRDVYDSRKGGTYIYALLVVEPAQATVRDSIDMYIYADIMPGSKVTTLFTGSGGDTYFDFTEPCPNNCPW